VRSEGRRVDPFFQDTPWDLIYDDAGRQIGEVYILLGDEKREGMPYENRYSRRTTDDESNHRRGKDALERLQKNEAG
jgi:hypothetical protein